ADIDARGSADPAINERLQPILRDRAGDRIDIPTVAIPESRITESDPCRPRTRRELSVSQSGPSALTVTYRIGRRWFRGRRGLWRRGRRGLWRRGRLRRLWRWSCLDRRFCFRYQFGLIGRGRRRSFFALVEARRFISRRLLLNDFGSS